MIHFSTRYLAAGFSIPGVLLASHAMGSAPESLWVLPIAASIGALCVAFAAGPAAPPATRTVSRADLTLTLLVALACLLVAPILGPVTVSVALCTACGYACESARLTRLARGWTWAGTCCLVAGGVYALFWWIEPFAQGSSLAAPFARWLAPVFGARAQDSPHGVVLTIGNESTTLATTVRNGHWMPTAMLVAYTAFAAFSGRSKRRAALVTLASCALLWAHRDALLVFNAVRGQASTPRPYPVRQDALGFPMAYLPLVILLAVTARRGPAPSPAIARSLGWRPVVATAVGGAMLALALVGTGSEFRKQGRVLIDDSHGDWEWLDVPLDRTTFGPKTTYNYWSLREILSERYPVVDVHTKGPLDATVLARYDVVMLKTPTREYSEPELEAIRRFVRQGGGLWLVGDHTNIFGMNSYLNQLADGFGLHFRTDALTPIAQEAERKRDLWVRPRRPHPATTGMTQFYWATSCSLSADISRVTPVMIADRVFSDAPNYAVNTFFGDFKFDASEVFGRHLSCAAVSEGSGRVVAFTDSTVFSSFFMHLPGKPELAVATVEYLNRGRRPSALDGVLLWAGAFVIGVGVVLSLRRRSSHLRHSGMAVVAGALATVGLSDVMRGGMEIPAPRPTHPRVAFLSYGGEALPLVDSVSHEEQSLDVFHTMFVWIQRCGAFPSVVGEIPADEAARGTIIVNPPRDADIAPRVAASVKAGGNVWVLSADPDLLRRLLLAVDAASSEVVTFAGDLQAKTDLQLAAIRVARNDTVGMIPSLPETKGVRTSSGAAVALPAPAHVLRGVTPVLALPDGSAVVGYVEAGRGRLYLCTCPEAFSNRYLGGVTHIPTEDRYRLAQTLWDVIDAWTR